MAEQQTWQWPSRIALLADRSERNFYFTCKRCLDVIAAGALFVLLVPLFLLIAVIIKLDSPGPVFFTQERVGAKRQSAGGRAFWLVQNFTLYKFRSMVKNADSSVHEAYVRDFVEGRARPSPQNGGTFKLSNDPRVTRVGRLLRKFSLDELPQLFNVLKGEMSLVGPRPVPMYEARQIKGAQRRRLAMRPGITGLWQVSGRDAVDFEGWMQMDLLYVDRWSLGLDLKILLRTIPVVIRGESAV